MSSRSLSVGIALALLAHGAAARELRVCADPDNPPYSREDGSGFENRIAAIVAQSLDATLVYHWFPDRRGYLRKTLNARECDKDGAEDDAPTTFRRPPRAPRPGDQLKLF